MTNNKLVIRRLPPSMSEDDFLRHVTPLPDHDYFCFFEANPSLGSCAFSRAYINILDPNDTVNFRERFDNYIFLDRDGQEYPAVVEQSFWHKSPKNGPFYRRGQAGPTSFSAGEPASRQPDDEPVADTVGTKQQEGLPCDKPAAPIGVEQDPDFLEFMEKHRNLKKRTNQQSPIQTLENNLDELTNKQSLKSSGPGGKKGGNKVVTPLLGYVNQKRVLRNVGKRGKK